MPETLEAPVKLKPAAEAAVAPRDTAVEPKVTELFVNDELPIFDNVFEAPEIVLFVSVSVDDSVTTAPSVAIVNSVPLKDVVIPEPPNTENPPPSEILVDDELSSLIETVEFEVPERSAYAKFPNPASRYAVVGVYVAKLKKEIRVAVTGAEGCVFRCKKLEDALSSNFSPTAIDSVNISSKGFNTDIHASAEYRAHLISVLAKKAVAGCK